MKKRLWVIIGTILMVGIGLFCAYADSSAYKRDPYSGIRFLVNGTDSIKIWEDEGLKEIYVFLPTYADLKNTSIILDDKTSIMIDNTVFESGTDCSSFELDRKYEFSVNGNPPVSLYFLQSSNTASMYVNTASGSMDYVNSEKNHKEKSRIVLYNKDGELDYTGGFTDQIRGHGNHTWWAYEKKSYNLYLNNPTDLLGLGEGSKWVLLGNTRDDTHLRNKIVMDFAGEVGSYNGFSSGSDYVNLYANGEFLGLYLLCRSVDDNLVNVLSESDGNNFAIELLPVSRIESGKKSVRFNESMAIEIEYPDWISNEQKNKIEEFVLSFDKYLNGRSTSKGELSDFIDIQTWAEKYLVDLVFNEYDASYASKFFWGSLDNMRLYAGPCWDYDLAIGYHSTYYSFVDEKKWRSAGENDGVPWNYGLWCIPEFRDYVVRMYQDKFHNRLEMLVNAGIEKEAGIITTAIELERRRWPQLYTQYDDYEDAIKDLITYMERRIGFLDSYWVNKDPYCVITLKDPYGLSLNCYVPQNTVCEDLLIPDQLADEGETIWYYEDTREPFDYNTVITEDITLVSKSYIDQLNSGEETDTDEKVTMLSLAILVGIFITACFIDFRYRR